MFFIPLPIVILEVLIFSTFSHFYGFWDVFLAYFYPSLLGMVLLSMTGRSLMMSLQGQMGQGQLPGDKVLHRAALVLGSVCLIVPMFLTRVLAVFLILPILRHLSVFIFKTYIFKRLAKSPFVFSNGGGPFVFKGGFGNARGSHGPRHDQPRHERDAEVVNVTPIEITHTRIVEEAAPKKEDPSEK